MEFIHHILNEMSTLSEFPIITKLEFINIVLCINVVDVVVVWTAVVEVVRICIAVIYIIMECIIVAEITVFVSINVVDVVRMFIIVVGIFRVCILTNNQLTQFYSQSEDFVVV